MGDGGSLSSMLILSFPLALIGGVLLVLDGVKKEFETRAFFGVMCVVWAGLMVGHHFNRGSYDGSVMNSDIATTEPAADADVPLATVPVPFASYDLLLKLGTQTVHGDEFITLTGANAKLYLLCNEDISIGISSTQALPQTLKVTIESSDLEPSIRLAESTKDDQEENYFQRLFKMDTRCDLLNNATIVVEGLKNEAAQVGASASNKITVQLSKK
jgi:hypothetical protein